MCWSHRRIYDRPFLDCLAELDLPIARLTATGARAIVIAGMSQGGIGALVFGARRSGLAGIIALAPVGAPERMVSFLSADRAGRCRGTGDGRRRLWRSRASFVGANTPRSFSVNTTPTII
jgi:hypothetical protein